MRERPQRLSERAELPDVALRAMSPQPHPAPRWGRRFQPVHSCGLMPDAVLRENLIGVSRVEAVDEAEIVTDVFA
ncbi:hypothetical protein KYY02_29850 [Streptomyces pimonensis]|uniref:Uncharacterized protein n=1 Tax=Streptomyces pimonensis TaxID=2860288 RepID=A0ABV4J9Q6_9ACTN